MACDWKPYWFENDEDQWEDLAVGRPLWKQRPAYRKIGKEQEKKWAREWKLTRWRIGPKKIIVWAGVEKFLEEKDQDA